MLFDGPGVGFRKEQQIQSQELLFEREAGDIGKKLPADKREMFFSEIGKTSPIDLVKIPDNAFE